MLEAFSSWMKGFRGPSPVAVIIERKECKREDHRGIEAAGRKGRSFLHPELAALSTSLHSHHQLLPATYRTGIIASPSSQKVSGSFG